jgi:hypothetical protein
MAGQLADHVFFEPVHGIKFLWMALCCMQQKLDFNRIIWKNDTPFVRAGEYAGIQQCRHIAVNGLDITAGTVGCFSNGYRPRAAENLE